MKSEHKNLSDEIIVQENSRIMLLNTSFYFKLKIIMFVLESVFNYKPSAVTSFVICLAFSMNCR